jgi:acetyl esterase/lipase
MVSLANLQNQGCKRENQECSSSPAEAAFTQALGRLATGTAHGGHAEPMAAPFAKRKFPALPVAHFMCIENLNYRYLIAIFASFVYFVVTKSQVANWSIQNLMKSLITALSIVFSLHTLNAQADVWQPSPGHIQIPIWPGTPPDADAQHLRRPEYATNVPTSEGSLTWVCNVTKPTMTVYSPTGVNTGVAMVVFPGGGFNALAMDLEGTEICDWLNSQGITAVLLKYRIPLKKQGPYGESPLALEDAQRTLGLVRSRATEWGIDPHKIGVIGFSAGGYMVAATSNHFDKRSYPPADAADQESCRPDFAVACYPGHLWDGDDNLNLNPNVPVTTNTPPTFLLQADNDHVDGVNQALTYYIGLKNAGVQVEMHLYAQGGHGFGLRHADLPIGAWPQLVERWLRTIGMISN